MEDTEYYQIMVTGHSLGGALASVAALDIACCQVHTRASSTHTHVLATVHDHPVSTQRYRCRLFCTLNQGKPEEISARVGKAGALGTKPFRTSIGRSLALECYTFGTHK